MPPRRLAHYLLVTSFEGEEAIIVDGEYYCAPEAATNLIQPGALHDLDSQCGNRPTEVCFDLRIDSRRREHLSAGPYEPELGAVCSRPAPKSSLSTAAAGAPAIARLARAEAGAMRSFGTAFGADDFAASARLSRSRFCAVFSGARISALIGYPDPVFDRVSRAHAGMIPGAGRKRLP